MDIRAERNQAVATTVEHIRAIERDAGVTRQSLDAIKSRLLELTERHDLFPLGDFPISPEDGKSVIYRLSEDDDHRFALYASVGRDEKSVPPHNHTTWAVIVGVHGNEGNRFYERTDDGSTDGKGSLRQTKDFTVSHGNGVTLMPDDIHSIHTDAGSHTVHLHMYGLGLEQLHQRVMYNMTEDTYRVFPATQNIKNH